MAKFVLNEKSISLLKTLRTQHKIKVGALADVLGKSPSYITKLENGGIKTIDEEDLNKIIETIFNKSDNSDEFKKKDLPKIFEEMSRIMTDEEIDNEIWFANYDMVSRIIPVPRTLADDLNRRLINLGKTVEELCARINANEDMPDEVRNVADIKANRWHAVVKDGKIARTYVYMKVNIADVRRVLTYEVGNANYILILSIAYYIGKMEKYPDKTELSDEEKDDLMDETKTYLSRNKFYTLAYKRRAAINSESKAEFLNQLSTFDQENMQLINGIVGYFAKVSASFLSRANKCLKAFKGNMDWDVGFMMALISIPFFDLGSLNFDSKQKMLNEINQVVKKYKDLPDEKKIIEKYEIEEER